MRFHVLTLFPAMFEGPFQEGVVGRAHGRGIIEVAVHDIRDQAHDRHRTVDDYSFGGGPGMVMKPGPVFEAVEAVRSGSAVDASAPVVLLTPQGRTLTQPMVQELARQPDIVLICGRYEGVDERIPRHLATEEISVGDYVLSGGELAAMVLIDAVARLVPGVVGATESTEGDSFTIGLLQHPLYTRPRRFRSWSVPEMLLSGDHEAIARWRRWQALRGTLERRPDLLESAPLTDEDRRFLQTLKDE